jgi:ABC-type transporter Mla maintaining outer membrane lipid asymmetry ATPase subunit MlaF
LQDAYELANYVFSPEKQTLVPWTQGASANSRPPTRFLMLRDGSVYFHGAEQELIQTPDPYLRKFLA